MRSDVEQSGIACEVADRCSVLRTWLPGVSLEQVRVALHGDRLTIWSDEDGQEPRSDGQPDNFCRSVRLPNPIISREQQSTNIWKS
jgi:HSP20 family molecular chaperone IbpA